jgi:eukaryotic-like serine/threonine-protein kinase
MAPASDETRSTSNQTDRSHVAGSDCSTIRDGHPVDPAHSETAEFAHPPASTKTLPPRTLPPSNNNEATSIPAAPSEPQPFGGYMLLHEIARGGMGIVYKARQVRANRIVALKLIHSGRFAGPEDTLRFKAEAEAAANLTHPNIVPIFDVGEIDGQNYFSMGFIDGTNLRRLVEGGPLPNREAARIVQIVAAAMAYAHSQGIIHRDLKPENVLMDAAGQPHITDFGLAKRLEGDSRLTSTGQILGTPGYMSPEQAGGESELVGTLSDVYSLGAILYCLLTGRPPFQAPSVMDILLQVIQREPISPRDINPLVDADLETLCLKCLEKQPSQRLPTAASLSDELGRYLKGEPIVSRPLGRVARLWRWGKRNRMVAGLLAAVMICLVAGTAASTYFAVVARTRATQAELGRQIAVRTLQSVIFNVQKKLKPFGEAREVRRTLIKESLHDLEAVSSQIHEDETVDLSTAAGFVDLARLFEEIGSDGERDATAASERYYLRALEIYRKLRLQSPDDLELKRNMADAQAEIIGFYVHAGRPGPARSQLDENVKLRREIAAAEPAVRASQFSLCRVLMDLGEVDYTLHKLPEGRAALEEAIRLRHAQDAMQAPSDKEQSQLAMALVRLGDTCLAQNDLKVAHTSLESSLDISRRLQAGHPNEAERAMALSRTHERLGDFYCKSGNLPAAKAEYERMREETEKALQLDPQNRWNRQDYPVSFDKLYEVALLMKDLPAAEHACAKSAELRTALAASDPSDSKAAHWLSEDRLRLAEVRRQIAVKKGKK